MAIRSSISEELVQAFKSLGFTKYEALAYITLIIGGPMTVSELSNEAGIPYSRVNDTISTLEKRGFVEINEGDKKVFVAIPPKIAFSRLIDEIKSLEAKMEELRNLEELKEKPFMLHIRNQGDINSYLQEIIKMTEHELTVIAPEGTEEILEKIWEKLPPEVSLVIFSKREIEGPYVISYVCKDVGDDLIVMGDTKQVLMIPSIFLKYLARPMGFFTNYKELIWQSYSVMRRLLRGASPKVRRTYLPQFTSLFNAITYYEESGRSDVRVIMENKESGNVVEISGKIVGVRKNLFSNIRVKVEEAEYEIGGPFSIVEEWEAKLIKFL